MCYMYDVCIFVYELDITEAQSWTKRKLHTSGANECLDALTHLSTEAIIVGTVYLNYIIAAM